MNRWLKRTVLWQGAARYYRQLPMRRKLLYTVLCGCGVAALFCAVSLVVLQTYNLRREFSDQLRVLCRVVAEQSASAVAFEDVESLLAIGRSVLEREELRGMRVTLREGPTLLTLGQVHAAPIPVVPGPLFSESVDGWRHQAVQTLVLDGKVIAFLQIEGDFRPVFTNAVKAFAPLLLLVVAAAAALCGGVTAWIGRLFVRDLEYVTFLTAKIADTNNFALRAPVRGEDEIATLSRSFNRMLDRLQESDARLRAINQSLNEEIAARERAEGQLLESSRLAGMAQVATGVLHNVGNVLNSVNVSVQLIQDTVSTHPRLALLQQTTALLRAQGADVNRFLNEDPRGRLVPRLLIELGDQVTLIQRELSQEAGRLGENVDHIKEIISMQQSYAKAGGVTQNIQAIELFDEALRIAYAAVARHGVAVERMFADTPTITTVRHQVLQILVNFITNAVHAVAGQPAGERRVKLVLQARSEGVAFGVVDNGVGIPPENAERIFQHGFTTRSDGHGFGLHSGALAARNLGGAVRMESAGRGCGATFWLELPLAAPKATPSEGTTTTPSKGTTRASGGTQSPVTPGSHI